MLIHHKGQVSCLIAPSRERISLSGEHSVNAHGKSKGGGGGEPPLDSAPPASNRPHRALLAHPLSGPPGWR